MQTLSRQDEPAPALGPWTQGYVNAVSPHEIPDDGLAEATDCDIDREGRITTRLRWASLDATASYSDIFVNGNTVFAVRNGSEAGIVLPDSFDPIGSVTNFGTWAALDAFTTLYCDYEGVYQVDVPSRTAVRMTAGVDDTVGHAAQFDIEDMPGGRAMAIWNGRILVLRGRTLYWSEPFRMGACSRSRNYVRFPRPATWIAALDSGVYVGVEDSVVFLRGRDPNDFQYLTVAGAPSPYAAAVSSTEYMTNETTQGMNEVAVWFSDVGFVVGLPSGSVVYPQADRIKGLPLLSRNMVIVDDRAYVFATEGG